jgi:hypothetical protein
MDNPLDTLDKGVKIIEGKVPHSDFEMLKEIVVQLSTRVEALERKTFKSS